MKKYTLNKTVTKIIGVLLLLLLWQLLSLLIKDDSFIFPSPIKTIIKVIELLNDSYTYRCVLQTMIRMLLGFVISIILAFIIGVIAGNSETIQEIIKPTITIFKSIPTACLVYLFLLIFGARITPMIIVVLISFPILYESIVGGIKATPKSLIEACEIDGASLFCLNMKVKIPLAIPYIVVGVSSSFSLSLKIEIMAEVITGYTRLGLGSAILSSQRNDPTNLVSVFAYSFIAIVIMLIFDNISNYIKQKFESRYM